jgi:hypothetical protein
MLYRAAILAILSLGTKLQARLGNIREYLR